MNLTREVITDVANERMRQDGMWGKQKHEYPVWLMILTEELGEVSQAMQKEWGWAKPSDSGDLYEELIHVAAVAVAIAEQVREEKEKNDLKG